MSAGRAYVLLATMLFAAAGSEIASAQFAASGPPLPAERRVSETPRSVTAQEYRDAYCAKWTDGCSICERATIKDEPRCRSAGTPTCEQTPVECKATLKSIGRVCLAYTDGCNTCGGRSCTARACITKQADGTTRLKDPNFQCYAPRREHYDNPQQLLSDLQGHWKLTDPGGRTCEIVNGFVVWLTPACLGLGDPVTALRAARLSGDTFQLTRFNGEVLLSFDTSNPDDLVGKEASQGYRLIRLEVEPRDPRWWEGSWRMRHDGYACNMFLMMRSLVTGPRPFVDFVQEPRGVSFASNCLDPIEPGNFRITHMDNAKPPLLLPVWTNWQTEGHQIAFNDLSGRIVRFTRDFDGAWTAEIPSDGPRPVTLRLERMPH